MAVFRKWQEELVALAWINIGLIVLSLPLFAIFIIESVEGDGQSSLTKFVLHTERGQHFMEIIIKYCATMFYWIPLSIFMKIGAQKTNFSLIKACIMATLIFIFLLAVQLILEPPETTIFLLAYGVSFTYLLTSAWIMRKYLEELYADVGGDTDPVLPSILNPRRRFNTNAPELDDVADERFVFRLQPLNKTQNKGPGSSQRMSANSKAEQGGNCSSH